MNEDPTMILNHVDHVSPTIPYSTGTGRLIVLEYNGAVLKMTQKCRSLLLRHVTRTHRVALDLLFERLHTDDGINMRYIAAKQQVAVMLTYGQVDFAQWKHAHD